MDMLRRHRSSHDHHFPRLAYLADQIAGTLGHPSAQYLVSVLRAPYDVILQIVNRLPAIAVLRHLPYSRKNRAAKSEPPKRRWD